MDRTRVLRKWQLSVLILMVTFAGSAGLALIPIRTAQTAPTGPAVVRLARHATLGPILTDGVGRTVYMFLKDGRVRSNCSGECAQRWPPLLTSGTPSAGDGVAQDHLDTLRRPDGGSQVTYSGMPLLLRAGFPGRRCQRPGCWRFMVCGLDLRRAHLHRGSRWDAQHRAIRANPHRPSGLGPVRVYRGRDEQEQLWRAVRARLAATADRAGSRPGR